MAPRAPARGGRKPRPARVPRTGSRPARQSRSPSSRRAASEERRRRRASNRKIEWSRSPAGCDGSQLATRAEMSSPAGTDGSFVSFHPATGGTAAARSLATTPSRRKKRSTDRRPVTRFFADPAASRSHSRNKNAVTTPPHRPATPVSSPAAAARPAKHRRAPGPMQMREQGPYPRGRRTPPLPASPAAVKKLLEPSRGQILDRDPGPGHPAAQLAHQNHVRHDGVRREAAAYQLVPIAISELRQRPAALHPRNHADRLLLAATPCRSQKETSTSACCDYADLAGPLTTGAPAPHGPQTSRAPRVRIIARSA